MLGYAWDIWPRDTEAARIATGHSMSLVKAQETVELLLGGDEHACFGIMVRPGLTALICRRSRVPGEFCWSPLYAFPEPELAGPEDAGR
jgi:hypothetical protein